MNTVTSKADKVKLHKRFNLYYLYDSEGVLWLNVRNLSQLVGEGSRIAAPLHYITKKLPKKDKLINNPYGNKSGALYIKERQVGKVKERIKNTNLDNTLINSLESSIENIKEINNMNKHLNTLKFQNSNDQPSEVKWFVDDDQVVWYDSVNILSNLGFTKSGFTIKEEIGKIYLERNEPKKLRAGRIHWNKESISVLKEIVDEKVVNGFWDNIEIIFNLINQEIKKCEDEYEKLLDVDCHIVSDLYSKQVQFLLDNGWYLSRSKVVIPLHKHVNVIYKRGKITLDGCKEYLKSVTGFEEKLSELKGKVDHIIKDKSSISTKDIDGCFSLQELHFVYIHLKQKGFIKNNNNKSWDLNVVENNKVSCKEEKPVVEFLPTPIKTIKYKELVSSKGWWVFKKEVWEVKDVDVYEDEVDSFVSSLTKNCEIIEIK